MKTQFIVCEEYWSSRILIIALDVVESIFWKTREEVVNETDENIESLNELCTVINLKNGRAYHIKNSIDEIVSFIKGEQNG